MTDNASFISNIMTDRYTIMTLQRNNETCTVTDNTTKISFHINYVTKGINEIIVLIFFDRITLYNIQDKCVTSKILAEVH